MTLFSKASEDLYATNTNNAFTARLAKTIELGPNDRWEVAVCEFTCPAPKTGTFKEVIVIGETIA
jgi:hypothetical protein